MRRLVDPATASPYAQFIDPVLNADRDHARRRSRAELGVTAPDDRTVVIRLATPAPYLLGLLAQPGTFPVHGPSLAAQRRGVRAPGKLVSNGAFVLEDWVIGSHVVLRRNRNYWNNAATQLERVHFVHIADAGTELRQYRAGELDITYVVPPPQFTWIKQNLPAELHVVAAAQRLLLRLQPHAPAVQGQPEPAPGAVDGDRSRQAHHRGDRAWVRRRPTAGCRAGSANYTPQQFDYATRPYAERLAEARELYRKAGYSADKPLQVELRYNSGEVHNRLAVAVAAMWKEALGVETTLYAEEFRALLQSIQARKDTQVFRSSWVGDFNDAYTLPAAAAERTSAST